MPKVVDHDQRRDEISDVVLQLIAREGINGVTLRAVAAASNWSTGVLGHYFKNRNDLLIAALRRAAYLQAGQFKEARQQDGTAIEQLQNLLVSTLPLDPRRVALTRIFLFFYAEGANDELWRDEVSEYLQNWRRVVSKTLRRAIEQGEIAANIDVDSKALQLVACTDAIAGHAVLDPAVMRQLRNSPALVVDGMLESLGERSST